MKPMKTLVFYAEDEPFLGKVVKESLEFRGFEVMLFTEGNKALELLKTSTPDICILDVMLPGMSGYTVVRTLREEHNWVPVLMLSAKDGEYDQADALDYGADDYLKR